MTGNDANHENYLAVLSALSQVSADPGHLVALLAAADDEDAAVRLLREAYDFTPVQARAVRAPRSAEVVIAGVEHRVEGADLDDCLRHVVSLVREKLARPQRRRVAVSTGLADGPTRILVDPVGSAEYFYDAG